MDRNLVLARFDDRLRRNARPDTATAVVERTGAVVRQVGTAADWNGVLWSDLDEAGADAAVTETIERYAALGLDFEWKWYAHDRPADLPDRLRAAGFEPDKP